MPQTRRSHLKVYLGLFISLGCLIWVAMSVERDDVFARVSNVRVGYLLLAILTTLSSYLLRAWRWPAFFDREGPKFADSFRCLIIGFFMNNVLPARIGEFVRAHLGGSATRRSRSVVLATIAGERLADGLAISVLFSIFFSLERLSHPSAHGDALYYVALMFLGIAVMTLVVLSMRERLFRVLERIGKVMPGHLSAYTLVRLRRFVDALAPMFRPMTAVRISLMSAVIWGIELLVYYFVTQAFNISMSVGGLTLFLAAVNFSSLIPAAPAGAGVIELVATEALEELGIGRATALAMVTTQHLIQFAVVGFPGAFFFFFRMGGKIPEEKNSAELEEEGIASKRFADVSEPRPVGEELRAAESMPDEAPAEELLDLSVVIPAYNEELRLPNALLEAYEYLRDSGRSFEIIVVDDGSTDETATVVRRFHGLAPEVRLLGYPTNRGKGYAVKFGVLNARGRYVLFADADGATPIAELERLQAAASAGAQIAIGSRALFSVDTGVRTVWYRKLVGRVFNAFVNVIVLPGVADTQCGFKLFTRGAARFLFRRQRAERFSFDVEILFLARKAGFRIAEVPINWTNVSGSKVNLARDSIAMGIDVLRFRIRDILGRYGSFKEIRAEQAQVKV